MWSSVFRNGLLRIVATVSARFPELGPDVGVGEGPQVADSVVVEVVRVFLFLGRVRKLRRHVNMSLC